jgi:TatA/E family protein of Tat protein translocase
MPLPSGFEWIIILAIALLILGPGKLPEVASSLGKSIREFRKASSDIQDAVKVDTSTAPAVPAQPVAPTTQATPAPNALQTAAEPNVLGQTATAVPPVTTPPEAPAADSSPTDVAPTAHG